MNKSLLFFLLLETLAFVASLYHYRRNKSKSAFYLAAYLGLTVLIEIIGYYTVLLKALERLDLIEGTFWEKNFWLYNIQLIISAVFYTVYFKWQLTSKVSKKLLSIVVILFSISAVAYLIFSGVYTVAFSPFTLIAGTLMVLFSIGLYYLELLQSDLILNVTRSLPFYISIGVIIFNLCTPPLFLYSMFFSLTNNPEFVPIYTLVIFGSNLIMYSIFILGFIICSRVRKH